MTAETILVVGNGSLLASCLQALVCRTGFPVKCIETGSPAFSAIPNLCQRLGVQYSAATVGDALNQERESVQQATLVLSIHNIVIFSAACVANRNLRIVNFHNSLLPRHPGRNAPSWAIYDMDDEAGITWHEVEARVDAGGVIAQRRFPLTPRMTGIQATKSCVNLGLDCFGDILPSLLSGDYRVSPQVGQRGKMHLAREVPNNGVFDGNWPVEKMSAFLRALEYGAHAVFERPKIYHNGVLRTISRYSLEFANDGADFRSSEDFDLAFSSNDLTVRLQLASDSDHR